MLSQTPEKSVDRMNINGGTPWKRKMQQALMVIGGSWSKEVGNQWAELMYFCGYSFPVRRWGLQKNFFSPRDITITTLSVYASVTKIPPGLYVWLDCNETGHGCLSYQGVSHAKIMTLGQQLGSQATFPSISLLDHNFAANGLLVVNLAMVICHIKKICTYQSGHTQWSVQAVKKIA